MPTGWPSCPWVSAILAPQDEGDRPPSRERAPLWHARLLGHLREIGCTLLVGQYAQKHYLRSARKNTLTETVRAFAEYGPRFFPLPHPSWRSVGWIRQNRWFEERVLPDLREVDAKIGLAGRIFHCWRSLSGRYFSMTVSSRSTDMFSIVTDLRFLRLVGGPRATVRQERSAAPLELLGRRAEFLGDQRDRRAFRRGMHAGAAPAGRVKAKAPTTRTSISPKRNLRRRRAFRRCSSKSSSLERRGGPDVTSGARAVSWSNTQPPYGLSPLSRPGSNDRAAWSLHSPAGSVRAAAARARPGRRIPRSRPANRSARA